MSSQWQKGNQTEQKETSSAHSEHSVNTLCFGLQIKQKLVAGEGTETSRGKMGSDSGAACPQCRTLGVSALESSVDLQQFQANMNNKLSLIFSECRDLIPQGLTADAADDGGFLRWALLQGSSDAGIVWSAHRKVFNEKNMHCGVYSHLLSNSRYGIGWPSQSRLHDYGRGPILMLQPASLIGQWLWTHVFPRFSHWSATLRRQHMCPIPLCLHSHCYQVT